MPNYQTPGVYIEELPAGPRPVESVGTSTVGFVGAAPDSAKRVHEAVAITSWSQFQQQYVSEKSSSTPLSHAVFGFFQNGGSLCYVVNIGKDKTIIGEGPQRRGLAVLDEIDEIAIVAAPGFTDAVSYDALLTHCENREDRFAILEAPGEIKGIQSLLKIATPDDGGGDGEKGVKARMSKRGFGGYYFPWVKVADPLNPSSIVSVPPSGHIAGIFARTDSARGVHKAPANEVVRGALDLSYRITGAEQGELNVNGVNCIRMFPSEGILVWGARTLAPMGSPWKYVNVRRLMCMINESIAQSTQWAVFEPNTRILWNSLRRNIEAFLYRIWMQGALKGAKPQEAYFVKCDEETNRQETIDAGMVITVIGVAPAKPAEFVVFKIGQSSEGTQITEE